MLYQHALPAVFPAAADATRRRLAHVPVRWRLHHLMRKVRGGLLLLSVMYSCP